jgi:hypothetical protein
MKKMKTLRNKSKVTTIALVLVLTIAASFISFLPIVYAAELIDVDVYLFLSVAPNPVGVGQDVWIVMMCSRLPATDAKRHAIFWQNWVVTATKPDGTKVKVGTYKSDIAGATFTRYVPDEIGRTTSDTNGAFGCVVDPPVPGKYKIIATFEGSESYFSSTASTYLWVEEAPSPAQRIEPEAPEEPAEEQTEPEAPTEPEEPEEPTEPEPTEPTEAPLFTTTDLAIIAAVAVAVVIGVAAYWQLRKRK